MKNYLKQNSVSNIERTYLKALQGLGEKDNLITQVLLFEFTKEIRKIIEKDIDQYLSVLLKIQDMILEQLSKDMQKSNELQTVGTQILNTMKDFAESIAYCLGNLNLDHSSAVTYKLSPISTR